MYRAEVLSKFPVIQHTYFGSLFTLHPATETHATNRIETVSVGAAKIPPKSNLPQNIPGLLRLPATAPKPQ